jgi:hypothetical protein
MIHDAWTHEHKIKRREKYRKNIYYKTCTIDALRYEISGFNCFVDLNIEPNILKTVSACLRKQK